MDLKVTEENTQLSRQEIAERLQKASEETFSMGYVSGLKSVLPFIEKLSKEMSQITESISDYLAKNDPHHGKTSKEVAEEAAEVSKKLNEELEKNTDN